MAVAMDDLRGVKQDVHYLFDVERQTLFLLPERKLYGSLQEQMPKTSPQEPYPVTAKPGVGVDWQIDLSVGQTPRHRFVLNANVQEMQEKMVRIGGLSYDPSIIP